MTYSCGDKVRQMKKKTFRGHNNSGFACQVGFSPNGQFLASGDGKGQLHFFDFKSTKVITSLIICSHVLFHHLLIIITSPYP